MTFEEIKEIARSGVKVTHKYFSSNEWMIMSGNLIIFEDGVQIFASDWMGGKDYFLGGWSVYVE